jgi:RNA polymerase sigma factor (sigma-70 family)
MPKVKGLTKEERKKLESLLEEGVEYFDHPAFHPPKEAGKRLFSDDVEIPDVEIGWYLSYLNVRDKVVRWQKKYYKKNVLLTREQEEMLFLRLNFARFKLSGLFRRARCKGLNASVGREIFHWYAVASKCRSQIISMNLASVLAIAHKHYGQLDTSEMIGIGNEKLVEAVDKFDISLGFKFITYVWKAIQRAILRERKTEAIHATNCPCSFESDKETELQAVEDCRPRLDNVESLQFILDGNKARLTKREQYVIRRRFFELNNEGKQPRLEEVGTELGVSRTCVQIDERKALDKLKEAWFKLFK